MAAAFYNLTSDAGLKKLDEYLLTRSYITGCVTFCLHDEILSLDLVFTCSSDVFQVPGIKGWSNSVFISVKATIFWIC